MKKIVFFFLIFTLLCLNNNDALASTNNSAEAISYQFQNLKQTTPNFIGHVDQYKNVPDFLFGKPLFKAKDRSNNFTETIFNFFKQYPDLFKVPLSDFTIQIEHPKNRNITQVHLFQRFRNVPVFGSEMILTFNRDNDLVVVLGHNTPSLFLDVKPTVSVKQAQQVAAQDLHLNSVTEQPVLWVFNTGIFINTVGQNKLVWRIATNNKVYFIDANTQDIVYSYTDADNALNRLVYNAGGSTPALPGTLEISEGDDISTIPDDDAKNAYNYSEHVYNYFYNHFGLDSFDGVGSSMVSTVDYAFTSPNSGWCNPAKGHTGCQTTPQTIFSDGYTVLDLVGHEWIHGVDDYAVHEDGTDIYGLTMSGEPGALNESYSDIFGTLIQAEYGEFGIDWDIGENLSTGPIRSLKVPGRYDQPDSLSTECTPTNDYCDYASDDGVHTNSGIPNKAAYLIMRDKSDGYETFNGINVRGLGTDKAQKIFYYTLRDELTASATFTDNLNALMSTCLTLDDPDITTVDCESIYDAYTAIGVADGSFVYAEANISTDVTTGYGSLAVNFDGTDSISFGRNIVSYVWDFGDGYSSSGATVSHTYNLGNYTAALTITDTDGRIDSTTVAITISNPITPIFTITGDHTTAPATVTFDASNTTDATGTITNYLWDFGDGTTTSTITTPITTHTFTDPGTYHVTLTVTDNHGYTQTTESTVLLYPSNTISSNTTWSANRSPYVIDQSLTINSTATLTIEPGTVIKFATPSSYLAVSGTLSAQGTSTNPIIFTSIADDSYGGDTNNDGSATTPAAGDWSYILFSSGSTGIVTHTTIQYGGTYYPTYYAMVRINSHDVSITNSTLLDAQYDIIYTSSAHPTISENTISRAGSYGSGISFNTGSPTINGNTISNNYCGICLAGPATPTITNNTFTLNSQYAIDISYIGSGIVLSGNTGSGNGYNGIALEGETSGDVELNADNDLPYMINDLIVTSGDTMTIVPGTVVKMFPAAVGGYLQVNGTLNAEGTSTNSIVFTSYKDDNYGGDTNGDGMASSPAAGDWKNINFSVGSTGNFNNVIMRYGGTESQSMFSIQSDSVTIMNSTLSDSAYNVVTITSVSPTLSENTISRAATNRYGIYINGGSPAVEGNTVSGNYSGVYMTNSASPVLSNNTISSNTSYGVYINSASGTLNGNTISSNYYGMYVTGASSPVINNNTVDTNDYYGIVTSSTGTPTVTNNIVTNNSSSAIIISNITNGTTVTGNTGSGNGYNGVLLSGSTHTDVELNMSDNSLMYMLCGLTVSSGNTLTIVPGTTVKICTLGSTRYLTVSGTLHAQGTSTEPIIITSYKDDAYGGDTNGDGIASSPAAGDWNSINFTSGSTAALDYVTIQYGGSMGTGYPMVSIFSSSVAVTHSNLLDAGYYNLYISSSASPSISNTVITNVTANYYGVYVYSGSPSFNSNTIRNHYFDVYVKNGATPTFSNNSISQGIDYGLYNADSSVTITAKNNWWGDASGPYNATSNPTGAGNPVSNNVDFTPWLTTDPALDTTPPANVTLNVIQPDVWNKTITLNWTNPTDPDFDHISIDRTDASGNTIALTEQTTGTTYTDTTPAYGTTYTYTLYTVDTTGNQNTGTTTSSSTLTNPTPTNFLLQPNQTSMTVRWTASSAPTTTIAGYKIYYGTSPTALTKVMKVGNTTTATLTGLARRTLYYVAVSAVSTSGVESGKSIVKSGRTR